MKPLVMPGWRSICVGILAVFLILSATSGNLLKPKTDGAVQSASTESVTELVAILTALFTAALAGFAYIQIRDNRMSSERQYRAYVLVESAEFAVPKTPNGDNEPWYIHIAFKNFGQTPAHFTIVAAQAIVGPPLPVGQRLVLTQDKTVYSEATIPPGHFHLIRMQGLPNGAASFLERRAKGHHLYVWGTVEYVDIFGKTNFTKFQMVNVFGQVHQFAFCEAGNNTEAIRPLSKD